MTTRTETELLQAIGEVNTAMQKLINGERLRALTVGSGEFQRRYSFAELTVENLQAEREILQAELEALRDTKAGPQFRSTYYQMGWRKGY